MTSGSRCNWMGNVAKRCVHCHFNLLLERGNRLVKPSDNWSGGSLNHFGGNTNKETEIAQENRGKYCSGLLIHGLQYTMTI
jgi:hypothetical protein